MFSMTYFKTPMHWPGHMAIFWVIPFIIGIGVNQEVWFRHLHRRACRLAFRHIGMADKGILEVFEYTAMGFTMDILALVFKGHLGNVLVGCIMGAFGSFDKMLVNYYITSIIGLNANILIAGIGVAGTISLIFGGAGGIISSAIVNRIQHLHFPNRTPRRNGKPKN